MKIVRLAKVVETAKEIKTTAKNRKRSALKDVAFLRKDLVDIDDILKGLSAKRQKILLPNQMINISSLKSENRFVKRDSMTASSNYHKLQSIKLMKRKVSFLDMNNYFQYGSISNGLIIQDRETPDLNLENTECEKIEKKSSSSFTKSYTEKNYSSMVEKIRVENIDIFDLKERRKYLDERSENNQNDFENPIEVDLNNFLENNAITLEELLNDKVFIVMQEKKPIIGKRNSMLINSLFQKNPKISRKSLVKINDENHIINSEVRRNRFSLKRNSMFENNPNARNSAMMVTNNLNIIVINPNDQKNGFSIIHSEEASSLEKIPKESDSLQESNSSLSQTNLNLLNVAHCETENINQKEEANVFTQLLNERGNVKMKILDVKQSTEDKSDISNFGLNSSKTSKVSKSRNQESKRESYSFINKDADNKLEVINTNEAFMVKDQIKISPNNECYDKENIKNQELYKIKSSEKMPNQNTLVENQIGLEEKENLEEKLTKKLTQKLILMIMTLLVFLPILDTSYINMFLYDDDEVTTIQKFCLNSIDTAFTKSIEDLENVKTINRFFGHCIDLTEDGSSLKELTNNSLENHRLLATSSQDHGNVNSSTLSIYPPFFYKFNFTYYENYYTLKKIIDKHPNKLYYLQYFPNISWEHPDFSYIAHYEFKGFTYFRSYFSNDDESNSTIEFYYNNKSSQSLQSILNILKVVVIGILLIGGSMLFTDLITYYVVRPLDKVMTRLDFYLNNTDSLNEEIEKDSIDKIDIQSAYKKALLLMDNKQSENKILSTNNETYELDSKIRVLINLISVSLGKQSKLFIFT